jgi:eukaryotic-like serine/threonine-protein kinase
MIERLNAALEGRYRIASELGEGGMATVFLAEDLRHDRRVAIKVLKPELAAVIGGERFVAEIKTTAALQHPHILPLFDSGAADGFLYYVMPYVDGESLRDRLDREKQLSVAESVRIAASVASALQYAHDRGIIHRDIKPANILLHAGEPVVADFGIALAISAAGGGRLTETGMSVGTPHYMSPEQASADRDVSARSDIYALACVLYEMLTGDPPHTGPTAQAVLMRILTEEPRDVTEVRRAVPANVRDALNRALEKLPADRFQGADEFKRALADEAFTYRPAPGQARGVRRPTAAGAAVWGRDARTRVLMGVTLLLAIGLAAMAVRSPGPPPDGGFAPAHRYGITSDLRAQTGLAISRTGDVAYLANVDGRAHARLRRAVDLLPVEVPNTAGALDLAFSPAGDWLAFVVENGELRKVQLSTGTVVTVMAAGSFPFATTPAWSDDGWILFGSPDGIYRVPEGGGEPERVAEVTGLFPRLLPGGRLLLYTAFEGNPEDARVMVRDLTTGDSILIAASGGNADWSPTGHILYGHRSASIFAVPFDLRRRAVTGPPVPVQENVFTLGAISMFELSESGSLAYLVGGGTSLGNMDGDVFAWMEPDGTTVRIPIDRTDHADARISPDGRQLAYTSGGYLHIFDLTRGTDRRLTFEGENYHDPVWSPDGRRLAFTAARDGGDLGDIFTKDVDGRSRAELLVGMEGLQYASDWLDDGTLVFFSRAQTGAQTDIFMIRLGSDEEPVPLLAADWDENAPRVSPDRRLLAYTSTETGERHLFVREFPGMGGRWQVSERPVTGLLTWSSSGDALVYRDMGSQRLFRADLELEPTIQVLRRTELSDQYVGELRDVHPGDGRILLSRPAGLDAMDSLGEQAIQIMVVVNWLTELRGRLGGR